MILFIGVYSCTLTVSGGTISNNTRDGISSTGTLTVTGGVISENTGAGISSTGSAFSNTSTLTVTGGTISGNSGRGIYFTGSRLTVLDSIIVENSFTGNGGGIYVGDSSTLRHSGSNWAPQRSQCRP